MDETYQKEQHFVNSVFLLCPLLLMVGCSDNGTYHGDYPDVYTVAINNVINASRLGGFITCGELEIDSQGRTLCFYWNGYDNLGFEDMDASDKIIRRCVVLICQKADNDFVYFYPDYNFITFPVEYGQVSSPYATGDYNENVRQIILRAVSNDDLEQLKELNDWGNPMDESKCVRLKIVRESRDTTNRRGWL